MDGIIGGIEVEHQRLRGLVEGGDELLDEDLCYGNETATVGSVFQAAEGGRGGQRLVVVGLVIGKDLPERIVAQGGVIVEVFVAQGDAKDALAQQSALGVGGEFGVAGIGDGVVEGIEQSEAAVGLAQEESTGVGGEVTAVEVGFEAAVT
jgi:hypothetical protein